MAINGAAIISNVNGGTARTFGLVARANSTGDGTSAVLGQSFGASNYIFGVKGITGSSAFDAAGVKGVGGGGDPLGDTADCVACHSAGVRGIDGVGIGVLGIGKGYAAMIASYLNSSNVESSVVRLGWTTTTAISADGNITKTGTVSFAEPHPTDASKQIVYASLEGPEAGTYFRGRAKFQNGTATIQVPDNFRMVTDPEGLSIQVTPIGAMATVAVMQLGLDRIVVNGSRNVEFFYTVNGVRRSERNFQPIRDNEKDFVPIKADAAIPAGYSTEFRNRLIANGTYRPDGTVNTETAQRLGWDRIWEARARPQPQPVSDTP